MVVAMGVMVTGGMQGAAGATQVLAVVADVGGSPLSQPPTLMQSAHTNSALHILMQCVQNHGKGDFRGRLDAVKERSAALEDTTVVSGSLLAMRQQVAAVAAGGQLPPDVVTAGKQLVAKRRELAAAKNKSVVEVFDPAEGSRTEFDGLGIVVAHRWLSSETGSSQDNAYLRYHVTMLEGLDQDPALRLSAESKKLLSEIHATANKKVADEVIEARVDLLGRMALLAHKLLITTH
jgi:hypothetical protein